MYCPRCGHQPVSNELRFCSYCGFSLGVVKAALAEEDEPRTITVVNVQASITTSRHREVNLGVILMFLASFSAILLAARLGLGREGGGLLLTGFYAALLILSSPIVKGFHKLLSWGEPSPVGLFTIHREMGFGATLMFLGTLLSAWISLLKAGRMLTDTLSLSVLVTFVVLLIISPYLLRALRYLVRDDSATTLPTAPSVTTFGSVQPEHALPPPQQTPISVVGPTRVTTAEIGVPVGSVTEHTTNLLGDK